MRRFLTIRVLAFASVVIGLFGMSLAHQVGAQDATPEGSPIAVEASPEATVDPATGIVTLVVWYAPSPDGELLILSPFTVSALQEVAPPATPQTADEGIGSVDFDDEGNNELPRIRLNGDIFDAYPRDPEDPDTTFRWTYLDNESGSRPATLVLQVKAKNGAWERYDGTATFISRASNSGGVLVIVLVPPTTEEEAAAQVAETEVAGDGEATVAATAEPAAEGTETPQSDDGTTL